MLKVSKEEVLPGITLVSWDKRWRISPKLKTYNLLTEYQKKVAEKMDKLKLEMIEKMKRKGAAVLNEGDRSTLELLVRIPVGEINPPPAPLGGVKEPAPAKTTSEKPAK